MGIAFDTSHNADVGVDTDVISWSHTAGSITNGLLVIGVNFKPDATDATVTVGGEAATPWGYKAAYNLKTMLFYYRQPVAGAQTVQVTFNANANRCYGGSVSFSGVDQITPVRSTYGASGSSTDVSVDVMSQANDMVVDMIIADQSPTAAVGPDQTLAWTLSTNYLVGGMSYEDGAPSVTMSWTLSGSQPWASVGGALIPWQISKTRGVRYYIDVNDPDLKILNAQGRPVPPWEILPDSWIKVSGIFLPTGKVYASYIQDPELAYIESASWTMGGGLSIKTDRGEFLDVMLARAAGRSTM